MSMFFCKCLESFLRNLKWLSVAVSLGEKGADGHYGNQDGSNKE
jgi:hypothetical protein